MGGALETSDPATLVQSRRRTFVSLIHIEDRGRVEQTVSEAVQAGRPFELEYRVVTASGDERWVLERGCAVQRGRQEWLDGIIFDITERRRSEETARRAETEAAVARELAEARRRIVYAGDEARRRIERDLHDGHTAAIPRCSPITASPRPSAPGRPRAVAGDGRRRAR